MPLETGILAAFGAMLFWGIGDFLIQRATRKFGDIEALAFISIIGTLGLFPFVIDEISMLLTFQNLALLSFVGIITFFAAMLTFEALKEGKLSVIEVVLEIELPITAVLGFLFFRETLSLIELGIISLIFVGIIMVSTGSLLSGRIRDSSDIRLLKDAVAGTHTALQSGEPHVRKFGKIEKGVIIGALAAVGMALVNFLTALGSKMVSPIMVIWVPWAVLSVVTLVILSKRKRLPALLRDAARFKALIICMGAIDTLAWLFYANALFGNGLAIITAITESYPAIAIALGVLVNREKILPRQFAGAALALAASTALAFI